MSFFTAIILLCGFQSSMGLVLSKHFVVLLKLSLAVVLHITEKISQLISAGWARPLSY